MTTLIAKDLRLSLDALRPWLIILVGLAAAAGGATFLPQRLLPFGMSGVSVTEAIASMGGLAGLGSVAVAAWVAASVLHGDRRHGARSLAVVMPVPRSRRVLSKALAILFGVGLVALLAILLRSLVPAEAFARRPLPGFDASLVAAMSAIGAALALGVAPLTKAMFPTVMVALLLAMAATFVGAMCGSWMIPFAASEFARVADAVGSDSEYRALAERMATVAAGAAIIGTALTTLVTGGLAIGSPVSTRFALGSLGLSLVVAFLLSAAAVPVALRFDPIQNWDSYRQRHILLASDDELIAKIATMAKGLRESTALESARDTYRDSLNRFGLRGLVWGSSESEYALNVALSRVMVMPIAARASSPLAAALRQAEDYSNWMSAIVSLRIIPNDEPRKLAQTIDVVLAFPDVPPLRRLLDDPIAKAGGWTNQRNPLPELSEQRAEIVAELDEAILRRIATLKTLDQHRDIAERLGQVEELIRRAGARPADEEANSPPASTRPTPPPTGPAGTPPSQ
jgi:hypothetical protein